MCVVGAGSVGPGGVGCEVLMAAVIGLFMLVYAFMPAYPGRSLFACDAQL